MICSKCRNEHSGKYRYCAPCHAANARAWRKTHPLTGDARKKDISRSIAATYKRRGKLIKQPCEVCGVHNTEMHHDDYAKPLEVRWLCRVHHLEHHRNIEAKNKVDDAERWALYVRKVLAQRA